MLGSFICQVLILVIFSFIVGLSTASETVPYEVFNLNNGLSSFPNVEKSWGKENIKFFVPGSAETKIMRILVPAGAIDPGSMRKRGLPVGGAGFKSKVFPKGVSKAYLSYSVRFPPDFDFVKGGKLPGLYGGVGNSGGNIPNGYDGFSFRLMWGKGGRGSIYAYLPTSIRYGTGLLRDKFHFERGKWHTISQEVTLNTPGLSNGVTRLWIDNRLVGEEKGLIIRHTDSLLINGMFFEVFFGGNDDSWAPPQNTYIDFADVQVSSDPFSHLRLND